MMQPEQDWRIDNCKMLRGVALRRKKYSAPSKQWDHDHCAFCQLHISVPPPPDNEDAVESGWATEDGYHWVCEACFADFRDQFGWTVGSATS